MPNPAYNVPNQNRKKKLLKFVFAFVFVSVCVVLAYFTTKYQQQIRNIVPLPGQREDQQNLVNTETGDLSDEGLNRASDITVDEVREASASTGVNLLGSPSLSDSEKNTKIKSQLGNREPENHILSYSDNGLSLDIVEVKQGDLVTWVNDSTSDMVIVGDGWQTNVPREPGQSFSYGFLYLGEYKYTINGETSGLVSVTK